MKTFLYALCCASLVLRPLPAGDVAPAARSAADLKELAAVEQFLGLDDAALDQVAQVIARIRRMSPAERAALRTEIEKFRQLPEGQRESLRQGWGGMPPAIQDAWREMMSAATAQRRAEIHDRMQELSPEARLAYRRGLVDAYLKAKAEKK